MQRLRNNQRLIAIMAVLSLTVFCSMWSPAQAALVTTDAMIKQSESDCARQKVNLFLEREDVQQQLIVMGVEPEMAKTRVASLTDQEIMQLSDRIDQMPAGSGALETVLVIGFVFFLVLIILDIVGVTDIFPFIK